MCYLIRYNYINITALFGTIFAFLLYRFFSRFEKTSYNDIAAFNEYGFFVSIRHLFTLLKENKYYGY